MRIRKKTDPEADPIFWFTDLRKRNRDIKRLDPKDWAKLWPGILVPVSSINPFVFVLPYCTAAHG